MIVSPRLLRPPTSLKHSMQDRESTQHQVLCCLQVVVLDKLDYCATLNNLTFAQEHPNFKVSNSRVSQPSTASD